MEHKGQTELSGEEKLFLVLAEQIARPFLQMSHLAELAERSGGSQSSAATAQWQTVQTLSQSSLQLVDGYALSLRLHAKLTPLNLEPVTISSLLYDAAQQLEPFARQYGVRLELEPGPRATPVLADRSVLQSAMASLGQVFVLAQSEAEEHSPVWLAAHRSRYGVVAGLYGHSPQLGVDSLRRAHQLQGRAREPLQRLVSGPAAGVFVADALLGALSSRLHIARFHKLNGLATTLQPSQQLQIV